MKHSFLCLSLILGLFCGGISPVSAKDDDKGKSRAEKREMKRLEKEAKKAAKKKGKKDNKDDDDEEEDDDKKKKKDKKAVSNALRQLDPAYGKIKPNGKFFMYAHYTTLTEDGEAMLDWLIKSEVNFKVAKVNVLLINGEATDEEEVAKALKKRKVKYPMVMRSSDLSEKLPGYSSNTAPYIIIVDGTGTVKSSGGMEIMDTWYKTVGAKEPKKPKATKEEETSDEESEE